MMPGTVKSESHVNLNNSCNQCCCFQWKRKLKGEDKVVKQADKISKQESPRHAQRQVTQIHLDVKMSEEDDVVVAVCMAATEAHRSIIIQEPLNKIGRAHV